MVHSSNFVPRLDPLTCTPSKQNQPQSDINRLPSALLALLFIEHVGGKRGREASGGGYVQRQGDMSLVLS